MEDIGKIDLSKLVSVKKLEEQLENQRTIKNKKESGDGLFKIVDGLIIGLFFVTVMAFSLLFLCFLVNRPFSSGFISGFTLFRLSRNLVNIAYFTGFLCLFGSLSWISCLLLEKIYSSRVNVFSVTFACVTLSGGSVGISLLIMQIAGFLFGIDYSNGYLGVATLLSLGIFIASAAATFLLIDTDIFGQSGRDIDAGIFKIKKEGDQKDVRIDLIESSDKFMARVQNDKISETDKERYKLEINEQLAGRKKIKEMFSSVILMWSLIIASPLVIPIILYAPSLDSVNSLIYLIMAVINLFNGSSYAMKIWIIFLVGAANWVFSFFIHAVSFASGAILGEVRLNRVPHFDSIFKKLSFGFRNIVISSFKRSFIISVTNIIQVIWNFPFELFRSPNIKGLDHRTIIKKLFPPINFIISIASMFFSGIFSFFTAFKQFKLGMYTLEQIKKTDISSFDKDNESYLITCTVIFSILISIFVIISIIAYAWYTYDIVQLKDFYIRIISKMDIFSTRTWLCILYLIFMILFVVVPSTVEIIKGRSFLAKDLIIDRILIA